MNRVVTQLELIARNYAAHVRNGETDEALTCLALLDEETVAERRRIVGDSIMALHDRTIGDLRAWVEGGERRRSPPSRSCARATVHPPPWTRTGRTWRLRRRRRMVRRRRNI